MLKFLKKKTTDKEAEQMYKEMKMALSAIIDTKGFEQLVSWWEREYQRIDESMVQLKGDELVLAVKERDVIKRHLQWIENMR